MRLRLLSLVLFAVHIVAVPAVAQQTPTTYKVGVAKVDITPTYAVRLSGFGFRRTESEGVTQRIWAKALAIDDGAPAVLITTDNLGVPAALVDEVARRLAQKAGLQRERLAITASHTHTGPMLQGVAPTLFGQPIPKAHQQHIDRYTAEFTDKLEQVALAALADRQPARLGWGVGTVNFAVNRRTKGGPVDHDLPVLVVRDLKGKVRAIYVTYACHCVTLSNNKISGDWAGYAQELIQIDNPGVVALVSIGCGGDANPSSGVTGNKVDAAARQGAEIAREVKRLLAGFLAPVTGKLIVARKTIELPLAELPTREQWQEKAKRKDAIGYHARVNLARLDGGEKLRTKIDYPIQTWAFGDSLAMVFLPGEVVVDYSRRLKRELDRQRLWITAYTNDAPCYIPSERVLKEGGYEGGGAMIYYDVPVPFRPGLEDKIVGAVRRQVGQTFPASFDPARTGGSLALSPQQSWAAIKVPDNLQVELVAAEPLVTDPVAIAFGPDGRLWVCEMHDYPTGLDGKYRPGGRIKVLEDTKGDGQFDKATVFLDNIPFPTGITVWRKGVLVCAAPDILYAEDTKRDGKADVVRKLFSGFGTDNYQARVNSLCYGLDGWVYGSCGLFGGTIRCSPPRGEGSRTVKLGDRDFRIKPDEGILEPATGRTQQGRVRDDWGNWFGCDNTTLCRHYPLPDHYLGRNPHFAPPPPGVVVMDYPEPNKLYPLRPDMQLFKLSGPPGQTTAGCGIGIYRDDLLGKQYTGNVFTCEPVNLLVHRLVLSPKGSTFSGKRAPEEQHSEFLASTDTWCRPVQAVTGPDGCLYVVDMYRFVIEHPRWIPKEDLARLDVRAGSTMGRIYRIRPRGKAPRPILRLDKLDASGLVAALDSPNGCQRDLAHMMLLWRGDKSAGKLLGDLVLDEDKRPEARLHALCLLEGLGLLRRESRIVQAALQDGHPGVRRQALRLTERRYAQINGVLETMADDPDPQVRLQAALSMGAWPEPQLTGQLLAKLAVDVRSDVYLRAAVLSSINKMNVAEVLGSVFHHKEPPATLIRQLVSVATALGRPGAITSLLRDSNVPPGERYPANVMIATAGLLEGLQRRGDGLDRAGDWLVQERIKAMIRGARASADDGKAALKQRLAAVDLLGRLPDDRAKDASALAQLVTPQTPPILQTAAVTALARIAEPRVPGLLTAAWRSASPALQSQITDVLLSRDAWLRHLLRSIEKKQVPAAQISLAHRQRLLQHKDQEVRALAARLFKGGTNPDRQKVLEAYRDVITLPGNSSRGQSLFAKTCAACHRLGSIGNAVGPDLATVANRTPEFLLIAVLDPNREVDPRYVEYVAVTKAGRTLTGLLAGESATSLTLRAQEGREETLLRSDLDELQSTGRSMMPEGLEKDLSRQDLADLIAFIRAPGTAENLSEGRPLALHPDNPHYFLFRGRPAFLVTSGEHYGAVLNRDFDYLPYLDELKARGFNLTRTFSGTYREVPGSFKIEHNTLSPTPKSYLAPWPRSDQPGAADGLNKFDLDKWDPAYFARLKDFVAQAGKRGIVVELGLFCTLYNEKLWAINPMRASNNINGIGKVSRREVFALKEAGLTAVQEALARKLVSELRDFDNVYFEVCNEPYFEGVTRAWQDHLIAVIVAAEKGRPHRHLIAQNIANGAAKIDRPNPQVSIFNFHYATPPDTVGLNYPLGKPLGDDETGFRGIGDRVYRTEAWDFLLAGGAVFSNLDYSFNSRHPAGTFPIKTSPGGGGPELRRQLAILKQFLEGFDFVKLRPAPAVLRQSRIKPEATPPNAKPGSAPTVRVLAEPGRQYALYLRGGTAAELVLDLPAGAYRAEWLGTRSGQVERVETFRHPGGERTLIAPAYTEDIALRVRRQEAKR